MTKLTKTVVGTSHTADAFYNKGTAKIELQDYTGAIADFTRVIEINPLDAEAYNKRGDAKGALLDYQGSMQDYIKAKKINPTGARI